ncbi:MAG: hypothetical protein JWO76_2468 [Nocardioides sp.]|nr:hypothetical protein [Nocardioides sp.]
MSAQAGYPAPGEMIGAYRVGRRLGGGGMGVVFEAYDEGLHRQVALKVISPHLADDPDFRARFTREAQAQASLDSAHVVHVYAHGDADGRLYIATQLVPDGDLGLMLQAYGAPPVRIALDVIAQVATGLADAHGAGLVHRDIKPANVLLRRRDPALHAYLADFGIARQVGADATRTRTGTIGTPSYMAPELHTGGTAGVASDVYSLGCLFWATLSGTAPYGGTSDYEIVSAHIGKPVPQLPGAGPLVVEVNRILRTAMAKEPGDRYPTAAAMRDDLRAATRLPDSPPAPGPAASTGRRGPIALVGGLVVLAVAAVAGIVFALVGGDGTDTATDPPASATGASPATPPASPPSDPGSTGPDEQRAIDSFATELAASSVMSEKQSDCVARTVVEDVGLPTLVADGFFDEQGNFLNPDLADLPVEKQSLSEASLSCLTLD